MDKLDLNHELLLPLRTKLEFILNKLMVVILNMDKEAEIGLKIKLDTVTQCRYNKDKEIVGEYKEPIIEFQINEKIKEYKSTVKGVAGRDYECEIDPVTNEVYIKKAISQISIDDYEREENK